ncbi:MAG: hypothetical protein KAT01_11335 [Candidatus Aminicenantes bacterium]|nr:hypothetical protein [Candidatus Aminicenantes bacterium]
MEERKGTFFISLLVLLGLFFVFDYAKGHTQSKLFSRNTQVPAARIPESEASQVLVLATVHLKSYGENFNHDALEGLLDTLERYNPDLIAIESAAPLFVRDMFNSGGVNIEIMKDIGGFRASEFGKAARATLDMDWFEAKLPDRLAQTRVAFWDVRNFGIAANIRRALALNPGKKILVIIGATHKIFLDALFRECMDVKVVQLDEV